MKSSLRIALIYLVLSFLWILFSDQFVNSLQIDIETLRHIQTYKGWFFISISSVVLFLLINRELQKKNIVQQELEKAKLKAEESDQLKTAFLSNMSHEIRTPLNGILGFSSLLGDQESSSEAKEMCIEQIDQNGQLLLKIINEILEISKIQAGTVYVSKKQFDLNKEIDNIVKTYTSIESELTKKHLNLIINNNLNSTPKLIYSDPEKIRQILINLINNAIKFTDKGSITVSYLLKDKILQIYVEDTGIGISEDNIEKIFQRFNQHSIDKNSNDGVGLGLAISKGIAEALGGNIEVESKPGQGSCFKLILPLE